MQNRKEDFIEFVKTTKNKVHDWWVSYNRKLWTTRIFVYVFLLLLVIFVGAILFAKFNLFHTDANSARYMLSALVQSQAAIVAIVITLTLIAVQLTASAYSPRVIDIFKKNPDMWLLLGCYGISIFYGFIVLKLVEEVEGEAVSQSAIWSLGSISISFESCVSMAYWLGAFTFVALFPYMWNIIGLLQPESVIKRLAIKITKDNILNSEEDPIQPIMDIIHGSIMKYDIETTRVGLRAVTDPVIKIIDSNGEKEISRCFCGHLKLVAKLAVSKMDNESTREVIENLDAFCESTIEKGFEEATKEAISLLGFIGKITTKNRLEDEAREAAVSLESIGKYSAEKKFDDVVYNVAWAIYGIGFETNMATGLLNLVGDVIESLKGVGVAAAEMKLDRATGEVVDRLGWLGKISGKELDTFTYVTASYLLTIGEIATKNELETQKAAGYLAEFTVLSEKPTLEAIGDYELKYENDEYYHKFLEKYEQKLKKLRNEKRTANKKTESR